MVCNDRIDYQYKRMDTGKGTYSSFPTYSVADSKTFAVKAKHSGLIMKIICERFDWELKSDH